MLGVEGMVQCLIEKQTGGDRRSKFFWDLLGTVLWSSLAYQTVVESDVVCSGFVSEQHLNLECPGTPGKTRSKVSKVRAHQLEAYGRLPNFLPPSSW